MGNEYSHSQFLGRGNGFEYVLVQRITLVALPSHFDPIYHADKRNRLAFDNVKNRIMTDNIKNPRFSGVIDAYRQTWRETFDPRKGLLGNSSARIGNFYKVRQTSLSIGISVVWADGFRGLYRLC